MKEAFIRLISVLLVFSILAGLAPVYSSSKAGKNLSTDEKKTLELIIQAVNILRNDPEFQKAVEDKEKDKVEEKLIRVILEQFMYYCGEENPDQVNEIYRELTGQEPKSVEIRDTVEKIISEIFKGQGWYSKYRTLVNATEDNGNKNTFDRYFDMIDFGKVKLFYNCVKTLVDLLIEKKAGLSEEVISVNLEKNLFGISKSFASLILRSGLNTAYSYSKTGIDLQFKIGTKLLEAAYPLYKWLGERYDYVYIANTVLPGPIKYIKDQIEDEEINLDTIIEICKNDPEYGELTPDIISKKLTDTENEYRKIASDSENYRRIFGLASQTDGQEYLDKVMQYLFENWFHYACFYYVKCEYPLEDAEKELNNSSSQENTYKASAKANYKNVGEKTVGSVDASSDIKSDPLAIDLGKDGFITTEIIDGVYFDLDNNGFAEKTVWIGNGEAFLALDLNCDGKINNGSELFGDYTLLPDGLPAPNGFTALEQYDDNKDGVLDALDPVFDQLIAWNDLNIDGISSEKELHPLSFYGIVSIDLNYEENSLINDESDAVLSHISHVAFLDHTTAEIGEFFFVAHKHDTIFNPEIIVDINDDDLFDVPGYGTILPLQIAMALDETGELEKLVEQFSSTESVIKRKVIIKQLLYQMTGANEIDAYSRGPNFDARDLHVIEAFIGREIVNGSGDRISPAGGAASLLRIVMNNICNLYYSELSFALDYRRLILYYFATVNTDDGASCIPALREEFIKKIEQGICLDPFICDTGMFIYLTDNDNQDNFKAYLDLCSELSIGRSLEVDYIDGEIVLGTAGSDNMSRRKGNDVLYGYNGNDSLDGGDGNDILDGGAGRDSLSGGAGDDAYVFGRGYGWDSMIDNEGKSTIRFGEGIIPGDILVEGGPGSNDSYVLRIRGTEDRLEILNYLIGEEYRNITIEFADGSKGSIAGTDSPIRKQIGTEENEYLYAIALNSELHGGKGNDWLNGSAGNDTLYGDEGEDWIYGADGNDALYGGQENDLLSGENGDDVLYGNEGSDSLDGGDGKDILDGGAGRDGLSGGTGDDTYVFGRGYGWDSMIDNEGKSTIRFGEGIIPGDILVEGGPGSNDSYVLRIRGTEDRLEILNYLIGEEYRNITIEFADGSIARIIGEGALSVDGDPTGNHPNDCTDSPVGSKDHQYVAVITEATCTNHGYITYTCIRCGNSYIEGDISAFGHQWDQGTVTVEPTLVDYGICEYTCIRCGETKTESLPPLDHVHSYTAVIIAPTCTLRGFTSYICECGDSYVGNEIAALDHDFQNGVCVRCGLDDPSENPDMPNNPFEDVREMAYYYDPVVWAVNHTPQITNGTDAAHFSPDKICTRAQVVTFLWRAKGCPEPTQNDNPFLDVMSDQYYYKAVLWAVEKGITTGTSKTTFSPNSGCTRSQVVTFLWRAEGQSEPTSNVNPFNDVAESQYYYKAVLWAVEKDITKGTSADKFSPDSTCTRSQIVTFLYRDMK